MVTFDGYDIELSRGDTLVMKIELDGRDLPEGTDGVFTIKKRITSDEVVLQKRFNASDEELVVVLDADETNIAPGTYFWDVRLQIPMEEGGYEVYTPMEYAAFVVLPVVGVDIGTDGSNMVNPDLPVLQVVLAEAREVIDEVAATQEEADKALDTANKMLITAGKTLERSETALSNSETAVNNANEAAENANDAAYMLKGLLVNAKSGEEAKAFVYVVNGIMQMDLVLPKGEDGETPYIGANGNWFIGAEDSGVAATGPEGVGIETVELNAAGKLTVKYTDGSSKLFTQSLIGPAGYSPSIFVSTFVDANGQKRYEITFTDRDGSETITLHDGSTAKAIDTAVFKSSNYADVVNGVSAASTVTYECVNMTFDEALSLMKRGKPLQVCVMTAYEPDELVSVTYETARCKYIHSEEECYIQFDNWVWTRDGVGQIN